LVEVVTAFFILSVATYVFIGLYSGSLSLSKTSASNTLAGQLAQEYLTELETNPDQFIWPNFNDAATGELLPVKPANDENPIHKVSLPSTMPDIESAYDRVRNEYRRFTWDANVRLTDENASFVELIVSISWDDNGHLQRIYLTSALPRSIGEGTGS
jgi:hypothetical protein